MSFVAGGPDRLPSLAHPGKGLNGNFLDTRNLFLDGHAIVVRQRLASAFLRGQTPEVEPHVKLEDKEIVDAEIVEFRLYVVFETQQDRRHNNGHGHANHYSEHGKKRTHFVRADGRKRHLHVFRQKFGMNHGQASNLSASMGSSFEALYAG